MKILNSWTIGGVIALSLGLLMWNGRKSADPSVAVAQVPCVAQGIPLVRHVHPRLTVLVDGVEEQIPHGTGLSGACHRVLHTHEEPNVVHLEAQDGREYTLGHFMDVWGKPIEREGYALAATLNGASVANPTRVVLNDGQEIVLAYTRTE